MPLGIGNRQDGELNLRKHQYYRYDVVSAH